MDESRERQEDINTVEFIEARAKEIQSIEESIMKSNKKTMLFQRMPFYKRRRNRNYDKRKRKKLTRRKKDRHFLRTHTFYSKRFFMMKLETEEDIAIPVRRRLKSSKYIYKSQDRGFVFDESFRGICVCENDVFFELLGLLRHKSVIERSLLMVGGSEDKPISTMSRFRLEETLEILDANAYNTVQRFPGAVDVVITGQGVNFIGGWPCVGEDLVRCTMSKQSVFSLMKCEGLDFSYLRGQKSVKIIKRDHGDLETGKIICDRNESMVVYEKLIRNSVIPICLDEIYRLSLENSVFTLYDNISTELYNIIERSVNREIIEKYMRTPPAKKQGYDLNLLSFSNDREMGDSIKKRYFLFRVCKGAAERYAEVFQGERRIGRVIRSEYRYSSGCCCGFGVLYDGELEEIGSFLEQSNTFFCKNLTQTNSYEIVITNILSVS